jgi:hypothetical protein
VGGGLRACMPHYACFQTPHGPSACPALLCLAPLCLAALPGWIHRPTGGRTGLPPPARMQPVLAAAQRQQLSSANKWASRRLRRLRRIGGLPALHSFFSLRPTVMVPFFSLSCFLPRGPTPPRASSFFPLLRGTVLRPGLLV